MRAHVRHLLERRSGEGEGLPWDPFQSEGLADGLSVKGLAVGLPSFPFCPLIPFFFADRCGDIGRLLCKLFKLIFLSKTPGTPPSPPPPPIRRGGGGTPLLGGQSTSGRTEGLPPEPPNTRCEFQRTVRMMGSCVHLRGWYPRPAASFLKTTATKECSRGEKGKNL